MSDGAADQVVPAAPIAARTVGQRFSGWSSQGPLLLLVLLLLAGSVFINGFLSSDNLIAVVQAQAFVGIVAVGMTWVVLTGNFVDLSVPAVMAVAANAFLGLFDRSIVLALAAAIAIPLTIGVANGLAVSRGRANPVIATLGTATIAAGLLLRVTNGAYSSPDGLELQERFGTARIAGVPLVAIAFVAVLLLSEIVLSLSRFGAEARFTGANRDAARAAGIRVNLVVTASFVTCAALAGAAGIFLGSFSSQADLTTGQGYEFSALAAVVIGGTSLLGGIGSFWRTLVGVLVIGVSNNMMQLTGLTTAYQLFAQGAILILAVSLDAVANRGRGR